MEHVSVPLHNWLDRMKQKYQVDSVPVRMNGEVQERIVMDMDWEPRTWRAYIVRQLGAEELGKVQEHEVLKATDRYMSKAEIEALLERRIPTDGVTTGDKFKRLHGIIKQLRPRKGEYDETDYTLLAFHHQWDWNILQADFQMPNFYEDMKTTRRKITKGVTQNDDVEW